jgi:hypothetical protein
MWIPRRMLIGRQRCWGRGAPLPLGVFLRRKWFYLCGLDAKVPPPPGVKMACNLLIPGWMGGKVSPLAGLRTARGPLVGGTRCAG